MVDAVAVGQERYLKLRVREGTRSDLQRRDDSVDTIRAYSVPA